MRYPVAIEPGDDTTAFGVVFPDLPGCFSAGDTVDEALEQTEVAAEAWIDAALDDDLPIPPPSRLDDLKRDPAFSGWLLGVVKERPNGTG